MFRNLLVWCLVGVACSICLAGDSGEKAGRGSMTVSRLKKRIAQKGKSYKARPVIIVAFGDSVTMGATSLGKLDLENVYHNRLKKLLESRYPKTVFSIINAGVGGDRVGDGLKRVGRDLSPFQPDLVIIGFGLNDIMDGTAGLAKFRKGLEKLIQQVRAKTKADIVLLTPNFMCTSDNPQVAPAHRKLKLSTQFAKLQNSGIAGKYADVIRQIGKKEFIPVADVYAAWGTLAKRGVDTNALLANGLNHPVGEAHRIPAELICKIVYPKFVVTAIDDFSQAKSQSSADQNKDADQSESGDGK